MRDFEPNLLFNLGGHVMNLPEIKIIDNSASRRRIETEGGPVGRYAQRPVNFSRKNFHPSMLPVLRRIATKKRTATRRITTESLLVPETPPIARQIRQCSVCRHPGRGQQSIACHAALQHYNSPTSNRG